MKLFFSSLALILSSIFLISLRPKPTISSLEPKTQIEQAFNSRLDTFDKEITILLSQARELSDRKITLEGWKFQFHKAKKAFKATEYLAEYYDPEFIKDNMNGAPLPRPERNSPQLSIIDPTGFQIIEEIAYAENPDLSYLENLTELLAFHSHHLVNELKKVRIQYRHFFEAAKMELVRSLSLGVSGFDSPSQLHVIEENKIALESVMEDLKTFDPLMPEHVKLETKNSDTKLEELFTNSNFNQFNRYAFLTEYINPSMALLTDLQDHLKIEYKELTTNLPFAINFHSKNVFDKNFLNINYFTMLPDSPTDSLKTTIGKELFFNTDLSLNNSLNCSSCHFPDSYYDDGRPKGKGMNGADLLRNSPTLLNSVFAKRFFWDERVDRLHQQIEHVIVNPNEFSTDITKIIDKLKKDDELVKKLKKAYPNLNVPVCRQSILESITRYVATLVGLNSRFDRAVRNEGIRLTNNEIAGFNLFMGKAQCGICHFAPTFNGTAPPYFSETDSEVLGIPNSPDKKTAQLDSDPGREMNGIPAEKSPVYRHAFKTVTVRNTAKTGPYMHNGVFTTLEQVIDFYNDGGGNGWGYSVENQTLSETPMKLSRKEKMQLKTFLEALTDEI